MNPAVYAESSAILAWLLREPSGGAVRDRLEAAGDVVASRLSLLECARALRRAEREGRLTRTDAAAARWALDDAAEQWIVMDIVGDVVARAEDDFPAEPVGTLDALHLAAALVFDRNLGKVTLLSLDERIRANGAALSLAIAP